MSKYISIFPVIVISIIFINGLINTINPRFMWEKFESWKAVKEPSNSYFNMRRIGGIFAMIVSAGMIIYPYIMSKF
jgi:hypothetical protein